MAHRFEMRKRDSSARNLIISLAVFVIIAVCFWCAADSVSERTQAEERMLLEAALNRSITHCYAIEGTYPESLDYICDHYGIRWDTDKYIVDYEITGSNLMPDVNIFPLHQKEGAK